jgi:tRNA dimethylallyltransferase
MILVLTGATGSGKSELAISLAQDLDGEIINADAFQVYRELTIATAAPTEEMKRQVPHHLYAFVPLTEGYDIAHYQKDCRQAIGEVLARGKTPILVGGSGLYIRSALYDYDLSLDTSKVDLRPFEGLSDEDLHKKLEELDPIEADKISPNNRRRVLRDIQICLAAGESKTAQLAKQTHQPIYPVRFYELDKERELLYAHAEERVEAMFKAGLLEETLPLIEKYGRNAMAFKAIGVKELFPYLDKTATLEETKNRIKANTRHYIKNQYTWFRHQFPLVSVSSKEAIEKDYEHYR